MEFGFLDIQPHPAHAGLMNCPTCDAPAKEHPTTIDGRVFQCSEHGLFGVSGTAFAMGFEGMDAWEKANALHRARTSMRPCDDLPIITSYHL